MDLGPKGEQFYCLKDATVSPSQPIGDTRDELVSRRPFSALIITFHEIRFASHWFSLKNELDKKKGAAGGRAFE